MNVNDLAAQSLEDAADGILIRGWIKGAIGDSDKAQCAVGHLDTASKVVMGCMPNAFAFDLETYMSWSLVWSAVTRAMQAAYPEDVSIPMWNDEIAKDEWEVRDAFLTAAKSLRGSGGL